MIDQLLALGPYQWAGLLFGILYIIYAVRNHPVCWIFGIISCFAIALEDFFRTRLYSDGSLQIFYILLGFYGLYQWKYGGNEKQPLPVTRMTWKQHMWLILVASGFSMITGYVVRENFNAAFPFLDSWTTIFSIAASFLLVFRKIDNWIYWIAIDLIYIFLYFEREAPLFSILYLIFTGMAVLGFLHWRKEWIRESPGKLSL